MVEMMVMIMTKFKKENTNKVRSTLFSKTNKIKNQSK